MTVAGEAFTRLRAALSRGTVLMGERYGEEDPERIAEIDAASRRASDDAIEAYMELELLDNPPILSMVETALYGEDDDAEG